MVGKSEKQQYNLFFIILMLALVSAIFLLVFSLGTSPLYRHKYIGWDSDIFLAMGKFSKRGLIPYKDFFDHKGPFIIFIQWLGYLIGNSKTGVFLIQILFLTMTLLGTYKILKLYYRESVCLLLTLFYLPILNIYFDKGNLTEEYCLPFLMWSIYLAVKVLKEETLKYNWQFGFLYGVTFAIGAMTRLTNSIPIVILVVILSALILHKGQKMSILKNGISFMAGAMLILVPTAIYFLKEYALSEMLYATFTYNFKHGFERAALSGIEIVNMIVLALPFIMTLVIGIIVSWTQKSKQRSVGILTVFFSIASLLLLIISRPYAHYFVVWMPTIVLAMVLLKDIIKENRTICIIVIMLCAIVTCGKIVTSGIQIYGTLNSEHAEIFQKETGEIISEIPKADRDKVFAYNVKAYFYQITDINPCYRNFNLQDLHTATDERVMQQFKKDLQSMKAKYIVMNKNGGMYKDFIEKNYKQIKETSLFKLYKRK